MIESIDLGQILDGLRSCQESWKNTAVYLRDGFFPDDAFVCEECDNADEAEKIAGIISVSSAASNDRWMHREGGCARLQESSIPAPPATGDR